MVNFRLMKPAATSNSQLEEAYTVPLTKLQSHVLRILAAQSSPDSYIAGVVALNRDCPRFSDIFQDSEKRLATAAAYWRRSGLLMSPTCTSESGAMQRSLSAVCQALMLACDGNSPVAT